jgi:hypothetical protein
VRSTCSPLPVVPHDKKILREAWEIRPQQQASKQQRSAAYGRRLAALL